MAALLLSVSVVASRILGYLRDVVIAARLGAGNETDAYYAAFGLPDLLFYFLAGGALSIAFVPLFSRYLVDGDEERGWRLLSNIATTGGLVITVAVAMAWVFAPELVGVLFPGFDEVQREATVRLTRIVLPGPVFFFVGGLLIATEMANKRFVAAALAPLIYNACIIFGGIALEPSLGVDGFSWGVLAGSILGPFAMGLWFTRRTRRLRPLVDLRSPDLWRYFVIAVPLMLGVSLTTVDEWIGRYFASSLAEGSITWLNNGRRLMLVPIALVGQAIGQAALPFLSHLRAEGDEEGFHSTLGTTVSATATLATCAAAAIAVAALPLTALVYQHGAYDARSTAETATLLAILAIAIVGWSVQAVAARGFYAREDTWRPMILTSAVVAVCIPIYMTLTAAHGVRGIAMSTGIGITLQAAGTILLFRFAHRGRLGAPALVGLLRGIAFSAPAYALGYLILHTLGSRDSLQSGATALLHFGLVAIPFAVITLPLLLLFGGEAAAPIRRRLPARVRSVLRL